MGIGYGGMGPPLPTHRSGRHAMADGAAPTDVQDRPTADNGQETLDETPTGQVVNGTQMREKTCNLWTERAGYRCIPTTGATGPDGAAVMDSGIALEAARRYRGLETDLGRMLTARGNHVHVLRPGLLSFPIQQYVWSGPSLQVIERSARELAEIVGDVVTLLPRPVGGLAWEEVAKALASLPNNVIVVTHTP